VLHDGFVDEGAAPGAPNPPPEKRVLAEAEPLCSAARAEAQPSRCPPVEPAGGVVRAAPVEDVARRVETVFAIGGDRALERAGRAAGAGHALDDVGAGVDGMHTGSQPLGTGHAVAIGEGEDLGAGLDDSRLSRGDRAAAVEPCDPDVEVLAGGCLVARAVARPVVHDDHLEVPIGLCGEAVQELGEKCPTVAYRHNDRDPWSAHAVRVAQAQQ
jgi:hypothetical protein